MNTQEAPRLEYGPLLAVEDAAEESVSEERERGSIVNEAVTWGVLIICLAGWTVIGLFLWIPRVVRAVLLFSLALVQSTVTETGAEAAGRRLRSAASFFMRGFVGAVQSIRAPRGEDRGEPDEAWSIEAGLILRETAWALIVWYLILWAAGFPQLTPVDVVTWLAETSWSEMWSSFAATIASIPDLFSR